MQFDYVFFVYGFAFIFMAAFLWPITLHARDRLPWRWLIAFGLLHGSNEWLDMLAFVLGDSGGFKTLRLVMLATSFAALFEFGRRGSKVQGAPTIGIWIHLPLVLLASAGGWWGIDDLTASCRYAYGLPGALWVGAMLIRESRHGAPEGSGFLRLAGWCWVLYGVMAGVVVAPAPFFPAAQVNSDAFQAWVGVPVQLVRAALAAMIASCLCAYLTRRPEQATYRSRWIVRTYALLGVLLIGGYFMCDEFAAHAKRMVLSEMETRFAWLADNLEGQTEQLLATANTMSGSPHIAPTLEAPSAERLEDTNRVLDRYAGGLHSAIAYLIDANGMTVASSNRSAEDTFVGKSFAFRPYFQKALAGECCRYFALGAVSGERGLYCSSPVRSWIDRRILGVVVLKYAFTESKAFFPASSNYVLLSPEGVIFLSGNPRWDFHALYPIPASDLERLKRSRQFGEQILPPLLSAQPEDRSDLEFEGTNCYFHRQAVGDGWSIAMFEPLRTVALYRLFAIFLVMLLGLLLLGPLAGLVHNTLRSERNFREVFNSGKDSMFLLDMSGLILDVNTAARRSFVLKPTDLPGLRLGEISAEDEGYTTAVGLTRIKDALDHGQARFEWRSRRRTGERFWTEVTLNRSEIGGKDRVLAVIRDIHERKMAEQALRDSEAHFRQLFENMSSGVVVCELSGDAQDFTVCDLNSAAERILAVSRKEVVNRSIRALYPGSAAVIHSNCLQALHSGEPQFLPAQEHLAGEETKWIEHRIFRLPSGRIVCLNDDRTGIRALEDRLRQSEKLCAIGQLAGGIAHDFSNQLTAVMGCADLLRSQVTDARQRQFAELIVQAARRSRDLTRQLLAFARRGKYLTVPVDLHALIGEVVALVERSFPKGIVVSRKLRAEAATTVGDPTQIQNAILNLALNARDAMPDGGKLTFETSLLALGNDRDCSSYEWITPGTYVRLVVIDTGVGMDAETLRHVYEPFFTTKPQGAGTGLGLSAVYGTIQNHHGAIAVSSEPGRGTTFELLFPLVRCTAPELSAPAPAAVARKGAHVLVVDDEELICKMVPEQLKELGCTAIVFMGGAPAVDYYRLHWRQIDLVIVDMVMPGLGGRETFEAMQIINPAIKALLASGYSLEGEAQAILDQGVKGFLQKPYEVNELARKLSEILGESFALDRTSEPPGHGGSVAAK